MEVVYKYLVVCHENGHIVVCQTLDDVKKGLADDKFLMGDWVYRVPADLKIGISDIPHESAFIYEALDNMGYKATYMEEL
jgi:hypothetical protein